ncbi:MAG TPA: hypothetical protein VF538_03875 [Pyrinomonadaceae bacterium]|jgi:hypothetical protein
MTMRGRMIILCATFILLGFLYFSPSVNLSKNFRASNPRPTHPVEAADAKKLLELEFNKTVEEIKFLLQLQDTWYNYKYLFIGAMLALLLGQAGLVKYLDETSPNQNIKSLKEILSSGLIYLTVTFACVICVMIDMHIRRHMLSIQYLGLWIYYYAEPAYLGNTPDASGFLPWETFLRQEFLEGSKPFYIHIWEGLHRIALSTQLHFLSTATYLLYTILFQQMCLDFPNWRDSLLKNKSQSEDNIPVLAQSRKMIIFLGFIFVHLSTLSLTLIIHSVSKQYEIQLFPFDYKSNGWVAFSYYSIFWVLTVAPSMPFLIFLWQQRNESQIPVTPLSEQGLTT